MKYRCRTIKPSESQWQEIEADSPEVAASEFHFQCDHFIPHYSYIDRKSDGSHQVVNFSLVEIEGHPVPLVARTFVSGIWRKGGVKMYGPTLGEIASGLGWEYPTEELLSENWECEEKEWK